MTYLWIVLIVVLFVLAGAAFCLAILVGGDPEGRGGDAMLKLMGISGVLALVAIGLWIWRAAKFFGWLA